MKKSLLSGFSANAVINNLVFSFLISLFIWAGSILGPFWVVVVPAMVVLVSMFIQYCFDTGQIAIAGASEPPVYQFKGISILPVMFFVIFFGLYFALKFLLGVYYAMLLLSFLFPALISSFLVEEALLHAINPLNWFHYIIRLKLYYFVMSLILTIAALFLSQIPSGLWLWPKLFTYQTILLGTCFSLGHFIHQQRVKLDIITPETIDERETRISNESDTMTFEKHSDRWFRLSEVHEYKRALKELLAYLGQTNDQLEYAIRIMDELMVWRIPALSAKFAPHYVALLIEHNKQAKAFGAYQSIVKRYGPVPLSDENSRMVMLQFANDAGDHELAESLMEQS